MGVVERSGRHGHQRALEVLTAGDGPTTAVVREGVADDVREADLPDLPRLHCRHLAARGVVAHEAEKPELAGVPHCELAGDVDEALCHAFADREALAPLLDPVLGRAGVREVRFEHGELREELVAQEVPDEERRVRLHGDVVLVECEECVPHRLHRPVLVGAVRSVHGGVDVGPHGGGYLPEAEEGIGIPLLLAVPHEVDGHGEFHWRS